MTAKDADVAQTVLPEARSSTSSSTMRDSKKLTIWQRSHRLAIETHHMLSGVREPGSAATRNQLQRAMASIPTNISEGAGKRTDREFARYLDIALGSAKEAENHVAFARDLRWLGSESYEKLDAELGEIRRMLFAFARTVRNRSTNASSGD